MIKVWPFWVCKTWCHSWKSVMQFLILEAYYGPYHDKNLGPEFVTQTAFY